MSYARFGVMIAVSTIAIFGMMYLSLYSAEHVQISMSRVYMSLMFGSMFAAVVLIFTWKLYKSRNANLSIIALCAFIFSLSLWLMRSQEAVGDLDYVRAMIPHHSFAILTSERAKIRNPRVRRLADKILNTQLREIDEMDGLLADLERSPPSPHAPVLSPSVLSFNSSDSLPQLTAEKPGRIVLVGYWGASQKDCRTHPWIIDRIAFGWRAPNTCVLRGDANRDGFWRANCARHGRDVPTNIHAESGDRVRLEFPDERQLVLERCEVEVSTAKLAQFDAMRLEAASIDTRASAGELVSDTVIGADDVFFVRAWRREGQILKIVAPIAGGRAAGRDRAFYFRTGETVPFLISDPTAVLVLLKGRVAAWLSPAGELISGRITDEPDVREKTLLSEAAALRRLAAPTIPADSASGA